MGAEIRKVLVVCVRDTCRSPVGAAWLRAQLPDFKVTSAGMEAQDGQGAETLTREVAIALGLPLEKHRARRFTPAMGATQELILVMETRARDAIIAKTPKLAPKVMLFNHWTGGGDIADPYQQSRETYKAVHAQIRIAAKAWSTHLRDPSLFV